MKANLEIMLEHPVMFLSDPYAEDFAPLDIGEKLIASNEDCIAFMVRPYFEGGADVTISSENHHTFDLPDFKTGITTQSGTISLSDSYRFNYLIFPVKGPKVDVEIWSLDDGGIWVRINSLIEY